jgi:hypothetical protein
MSICPGEYGPGDVPGQEEKDRAGRWLLTATILLVFLAAACALVSFAAQYQFVYAAKHLRVIAAMEAAIPDAAALIFACLGVVLALHGKRALRARALNVVAVLTSLGMNALAASPGWKNAVVWIMPSAAYALCSDTLIGVVRSLVLARQRQLSEALYGDEAATPLAVLGRFALWWVRLGFAPASTITGFRRWVVDEAPVAPGRTWAAPAPDEWDAAALDAPGYGPLDAPARPALDAPAPGGAPAPAPGARATGNRSAVSEADAELFYDGQLREGLVPSAREIKRDLHVGQSRANELRDYLQAVAR